MPRAEHEAAEQFPSVEHLRTIADTASRAADVIAKSIITDDLMSLVRTERDENRLAVNEVLDKLESLFYVEPPGLQREIEQHRAKVKYWPMVKGFPTGWRHEVAVPLQSLWRTVAGLLIYFLDREPLDLGAWTWQAGEFKRPVMQNPEHPPFPEARIELDGRVTRLDDGLPTTWLGRLRQHATELRDALQVKSFGPSERSGEGDDRAKFVFRPDGDGYFLRGFGEQGHVTAKGSKGLHDIFRLVQSPGVPVPVLELDAGAGTKRLEGDLQTQQPIADTTTRQAIAAKRKQLQADIADADSELERRELQDELDELNGEAAKLFGLGGKSRDLNNPNDKLRRRVRKRINDACDSLANSTPIPFPNLAEHLRLAINPDGGSMIYSPGIPDLRWEAEPKSHPKSDGVT